jgi:bacillithiol biosynthesis cysteine-adding enzyme BshC
MSYKTLSVPLLKSGLLSPLMKDYLSNDAALQTLSEFAPEVASVPEAVKQKRHQQVNRKLLVEVLQKQNKGFDVSDACKQNIELLFDENTFTVTVAHQPSLLLHPAYYANKIASVIALAQALNRAELACSFVPVFWLGSEDHDFDELGKAKIFDKEIVWQTESKGALGRYPLAGVAAVNEQLKAIIGETDFVQLLDAGLNNCKTFGEYTRYLLNALFGKYGLVIIDQDDAQLKQSFAQVIEAEVFKSTAQQVLKSNVEFLQANYKLQASPREVNFFYLSDSFRERIVRNDAANGFSVLNQSIVFADDEMSTEIQSHPERFSPNVIYRPLFQEFVLPNIAFVGGGAECSYWLQLKPLFQHFNVMFPLVLHRPPMAVISNAAQKKIEKLNVEVQDLFQPIDSFVNAYVERQSSVDLSLDATKSEMEKLFENVAATATEIDTTLLQSVQAEKQKLLNSIEQLEGKFLKAQKRKNETLVTQLRSVHEAVFPNGTFQERSESFLPHLSNSEYLDALVENGNPFEKRIVLFAF